MSKVTCDMFISVDGFAAGPNQCLDKPSAMPPATPCTGGGSSSASRTPRRSRRSWPLVPT
jgi:hypothetical protein